ncbi:MAG: hypothetical protein DME90_03360 [Verrucomicrobia bacterium]|nr:MAG: hypothetical protein DME90_03360 [Verrucomicrobiota bacterium]
MQDMESAVTACTYLAELWEKKAELNSNIKQPAQLPRACPPWRAAAEWNRGDMSDRDGRVERSNERERMSQGFGAALVRVVSSTHLLVIVIC